MNCFQVTNTSEEEISKMNANETHPNTGKRFQMAFLNVNHLNTYLMKINLSIFSIFSKSTAKVWVQLFIPYIIQSWLSHIYSD